MKKLYSLLFVGIVSLFFSIHISASSLSAREYIDFDENEGWADAVTWVIDHSVIKGYPEEKLIKPYHRLTESQFLTMFLRLFNSEELNIYTNKTTKKFSHWASPQYEIAKNYNFSLSYLAPKDWDQPISRGKVAEIIAEAFIGQDLSEPEAVRWMYEQGFSRGYPDGKGNYPKTFESYHPNDTLARVQGVVFLYNIINGNLEDRTFKSVKQNMNEISFNGIEINDSLAEIELIYGAPKRTLYNDLGQKINTYYLNDYEDFVIVGFDENNRANLLYSNQDIIKIRVNNKQLNNRQLVHTVFNDLTLDETTQATIEGNEVRFFYDTLLEGTPVRAILIKREDWDLTNQSSPQSTNDYLIFDVTNSYRKNFNLPTLVWDNSIATTAFNHSKDMKIQNYFSHNNLEGESPFDRMEQDRIEYSTAGENIAMGYLNGIDAAEAWMNSIGHRENILHPLFTHLGVGTYDEYYTQNFYTPIN